MKMKIRPTALRFRKNEVVRFLEESSRVISTWFSENQFQANARKFHVLLSTDEL